MALRRLHGRINDDWICIKKKLSLSKLVHSSVRKSRKRKIEKYDDPNFQIDFVVTWVDGNDPAWLKEKARYSSPDNGADINNDVSRYRDWDIFQYWFRAVEKNAPWVNKVYLVTWGHTPSWLNTNCPKLKIIKHEDIIPREYLPTFNSHVIEWFLWRIPELNEHFVYFNDDFYIFKPLKKSDFFLNGLPRYCAIARPIKAIANMNAHRHARFNSVGLINSTFDVSKCILQNPQKWFNYQYNENIKYNIRACEDGFISGMSFNHLATPFRKSIMEEFCEHFSEQVKKTFLHKIRSSDDIMHQAVQMWEIFNGNFEPVGEYYYGVLYFLNEDNVSVFEEETVEEKHKIVCINDHENLSFEEFSVVQKKVKEILEKKYPTKSDFEV